jgi:hypothetical protein
MDRYFASYTSLQIKTGTPGRKKHCASYTSFRIKKDPGPRAIPAGARERIMAKKGSGKIIEAA